jgi:hypothetical protein
VVFHSFDVVLDHSSVEAQELKEVRQELMAAGNISSQGLTGRGQDEPAIFLVVKESIAIEALNHISNAGLGDVEVGSDIDDPGVSLGVNQFQNSLQIIFYRG